MCIFVTFSIYYVFFYANADYSSSSDNGYMGNVKLSKTEVKSYLDKAISDYTPNENDDSESFRQLANGFFQSEGTISARLKANTVIPAITLGQNLNQESLNFFVKLWHELGKLGSLSFSVSQSGQWRIKLTTESWKDGLTTYANYFNCLYGEKYIAWQKLNLIRSLMQLKDNDSRIQLVKLVYSLAISGNKRLLSLEDQLSLLNLPYDGIPEPIEVFKDNLTLPNFPFILGFLLGDGSVIIRIRLAENSLWLIPVLLLPQKSMESNQQFFNILTRYFKSLNVTSSIVNNNQGMTILSVEGINNIIVTLLPFFKEYSHFGYWKSDRIQLLLEFAQYISAGVHLTRQGLIALLHVIYSYPQGREYTLEYWINLANKHFDIIDQGYKSGKQCIEPYNGRGDTAGVQIGWRVVLPTKFTPKVPLKYFSFSKYGSSTSALDAAVEYRNYVIESHLNKLKSS